MSDDIHITPDANITTKSEFEISGKTEEHPLNEKEYDSSGGRRPRRFTWAYIKWLIWTTIAQLFGCSTPIITSYDNTWVTKSDTSNHVTPEQSECTYTLENIWVSNKPCSSTADIISDSKYTPVEQNFKDNPAKELLWTSPSYVENKYEVTQKLLNALAYGICWDITDDELHNNTLIDLTCTELTSGYLFLCNSRVIELVYPSAFTILSLYQLNSSDGLIDKDTYNAAVNELFYSVMPRNLSDSGEVSVPAAVRKMYAWEDPPTDSEIDSNPLKPEDEAGTISVNAKPICLDTQTASDKSFSPLSPITPDEGSTGKDYFYTTSEYVKDDLDNLTLPEMSSTDQTLAWAISGLRSSLESADQDSTTRTDKLYSQTAENNKHSTIDPPTTSTVTGLPKFLPSESQILDLGSRPNELEIIKPKRSSSLKSNRTPPDTPVPKVVRFADALGLDLATVRHVFDTEIPPKIPASATSDLELDSDESIAKLGAKQFGLCFPQPGVAANFIKRVLTQNVSLEEVYVDMPRGVLTGTIRVKSLTYEKYVCVRITYNNWITFYDNPASYVQGSYDGATDRFSFSLVFPDTMVPGDKAQFAIRYQTQTGEQYWDNNHGQNYTVTCYAKATDLAGDGSWLHYL